VPFKVEMVIRGYMSGHAAREYALKKEKWGTNARRIEKMINFTAIITPTTKADNGEHDADISRENILSKSFLKII
jgi:phosphoribosylaminoimidazole-succinocarboxamide synthase